MGMLKVVLLLASQLPLSHASERRFDVKDDIFAFPQYDVTFPGTYVLEDYAADLLASESPHVEDGVSYEYEHLTGNGRPYLCAIPQVELTVDDTDDGVGSETEHDLVAAADRGWQLLKDMEGQQCLFYTTGWWSYMFCYNSYVKQYHAVQATPQTRQWPPPEDPNTPSYILGNTNAANKKKPTIDGAPVSNPGELQTQSETTFLVQSLDGGTPCDLTGKPRKIEVQYYCSPGTPDRIGWIKESATCAYEMVVYTSRLCNDVVFQPPKEAHLHKIRCQEIISESDAEQWQSVSGAGDAPQIDDSQQQRIMVGNVELGGKKLVGGEGKKIERGKIVLTPEEQAEIVVMQKDGQIQSLSTSELKKLDLNPEEVATFQKEMQKLAGNNDWKIERLGDVNGQLQLRGIVDAKTKGKPKAVKAAKAAKAVTPEEVVAREEDETQEDDGETGSEEIFKQEI